jgi:hypothetical protein
MKSVSVWRRRNQPNLEPTGDFAPGDLEAVSLNTTLTMGTIHSAEQPNKYEIQKKCK